MTDSPDTTIASGGALFTFRARTREALETEFLALYALRNEITGALQQMSRTLKRIEDRTTGGARV